VIRFETHATSLDNEAGIASGHFDAALSARGEREAAELGLRHDDVQKVWCSDLQRSRRTAEIAFSRRAVSIVEDVRLREVDFGSMTGASTALIESTRARYIDTPYPGGECYRDVCARVHSFLQQLRGDGAGPHLVVGHRATWYALEHLLAGRDLADVVVSPWRWQPGWQYRAVFS
jgi:broad specificity phosphatase PhoE